MGGSAPSAFARAQRRQQGAWKQQSPALPPPARAPGSWQGVPCPFILPIEFADWNVWEPIRLELLAFCRDHDIAWHDGDSQDYGARATPGPSPHLLDSQVFALNFWWGLGRTPEALRAALRLAVDDVARVTAPQAGGPMAEPEWIGLANYLGEHGTRRRGQYATSADFLLAYEDAGGRRHGILLESKLTESYADAKPRRWSDHGTDRAGIYRAELDRPDGPLRHDLGVTLEELLIEPYDQHLRQQLLAAAMERHHELGFATVTCLHVSPRANEAFHTTITAPRLRAFGATVGATWSALLRDPSRYRSVAYEDLVAAVAGSGVAGLDDWRDYQRARYGWGGP